MNLARRSSRATCAMTSGRRYFSALAMSSLYRLAGGRWLRLRSADETVHPEDDAERAEDQALPARHRVVELTPYPGHEQAGTHDHQDGVPPFLPPPHLCQRLGGRGVHGCE